MEGKIYFVFVFFFICLFSVCVDREGLTFDFNKSQTKPTSNSAYCSLSSTVFRLSHRKINDTLAAGFIFPTDFNNLKRIIRMKFSCTNLK